jgi:hypothetical protein
MRIRELDEFSRTVNNLIGELREAGRLEASETLDSMMQTARTTGSQLLGEIGVALKGMRRRRSGKLHAEADGCLEFAAHHHLDLGSSSGKER